MDVNIHKTNKVVLALKRKKAKARTKGLCNNYQEGGGLKNRVI